MGELGENYLGVVEEFPQEEFAMPFTDRQATAYVAIRRECEKAADTDHPVSAVLQVSIKINTYENADEQAKKNARSKLWECLLRDFFAKLKTGADVDGHRITIAFTEIKGTKFFVTHDRMYSDFAKAVYLKTITSICDNAWKRPLNNLHLPQNHILFPYASVVESVNVEFFLLKPLDYLRAAANAAVVTAANPPSSAQSTPQQTSTSDETDDDDDENDNGYEDSEIDTTAVMMEYENKREE